MTYDKELPRIRVAMGDLPLCGNHGEKALHIGHAIKIKSKYSFKALFMLYVMR